MLPLTQMQARILDIIIDHFRSEGYPPTYHYIAKKAKLKNPGSVHKAVDALCKKDLISKEKGRSRGIRLAVEAENVMSKRFRIVSLFSGCGGLDLGFIGGFEVFDRYYPRSRFDIVWANDLDKDSRESYKKNSQYFGDHIIDARDIWDIKINEIPDCDVVLAGFPCQAFSNAGNRKGIKDPRGTLFVACEKIIEGILNRTGGKHPKAFVFENVRGITSSKMEDGTTVPDEIRKRMLALGFHTNYKLIKASKYGVPQQRYRVIFVGTKNPAPEFDFGLIDEVSKANNLPAENNEILELSLGNVLRKIGEDASNKDDIWHLSKSAMYMVKRIGKCAGDLKSFERFVKEAKTKDQVPEKFFEGRSWKNIKYEEMPERFQKIWDRPHIYRAPNFYRRFALGEVCGTITASAQPENCGIVHPLEDRRFSIREIASLQTFPNDFEFEATSLSGAYRMIGNAVPPVLGWVVAQALQKHIFRYEDKFGNPVRKDAIKKIHDTQLPLFNDAIQESALSSSVA